MFSYLYLDFDIDGTGDHELRGDIPQPSR